MAKNDLRIDILGTAFIISTDEEEGYLRRLLEKYRRTIEQVKKISGLKDPLKTAVLTGFLLCDDLEKLGSSSAATNETGEAELLTLDMISRLDTMLVSSDVLQASPELLQASPELLQASPELLQASPELLQATPELLQATPELGTAVFKLQNTVKNYSWGSPEWIPALTGQRNPSRIPWAELWMGVNSSGPSRVALPGVNGENAPLLSELINQDREAFLGTETAENYGTLPFLFKVLAAAKPLSIQVHPNREQAREGFERENSAGIPLDAPHRNYKNASHKSEIICALNPFAALCGFRKVQDIIKLISILAAASIQGYKEVQAGLEKLLSSLEQEIENPYKAFLKTLFGLSGGEKEALGPLLKNLTPLLVSSYPEYRDEWELCLYLSNLYPGDSGVLAPLYLNIIELEKGEAMYLPAGVFHSYIHGMGIELMTDSDNVLRGGLTSKNTDKGELMRILNFSEYKPEIIRAPENEPSYFSYPSPSAEFALSLIQSEGNSIPFAETGPSIVIITEGSALIQGKNEEELTVLKGESIFIPALKSKSLVLSGTFTAYAAAPGKAPEEDPSIVEIF